MKSPIPSLPTRPSHPFLPLPLPFPRGGSLHIECPHPDRNSPKGRTRCFIGPCTHIEFLLLLPAPYTLSNIRTIHFHISITHVRLTNLTQLPFISTSRPYP